MYVTPGQQASLWTRYGEWAQDFDEQATDEALAPLDPWKFYPDGDRRGLPLPGWDDWSRWGFDPQLDAYFAQLWRNEGMTGDRDPDIWILGRGMAVGRPYAVATTHLLALEISVATGASLDAVCKAMLGIDTGSR